MTGGGEAGARQLDQTPTWAVSLVCGVIVIISIGLEKVLHHVGEWFEERKKKAMLEALEKIKSELMVLGFISLLLTFGQNFISSICIPEKSADTMLPCPVRTRGAPQFGTEHASPDLKDEPEAEPATHHRRLLFSQHRLLSGGEDHSKGCKLGFVPLISEGGLHQLHIFIFFLAVFHVIYSAITMTLGRLKIRLWKEWERETEQQTEVNDPTKFRLTHETSFVKGHTNFMTQTPFLFYVDCFVRQFFRSVRKADYLSMRQGFISVHLAPGSKFDFQKYIKRSLEDDFKVVVGISPLLWASAVLFLFVNVDGWEGMFWLSMMPLIVTLSVGTKLQSIIAQMAIEIQEKHAVVQGIPLVQVSDRHFWFSKPKLVLTLIHLTLFQNAFEITYFFWIWYEFGLRSCFHKNFTLTITRVVLGVAVQFLCSYITLPLYALVTQMGSTMKRSIFDEQTSKALMNWHKNAMMKKNQVKPATGNTTATRTLGGSPGDSPPEGSPRLRTTSGQGHESASGRQSASEFENIDISDKEEVGHGQRDLLTGS
ncbi:MLO-like protein 9 [Impatiens glandulifera]|uniref:MLO-like protein 9 n=1 Tax=Impatiens glandulifera TaxID=253017 RepID=UPI001FB128ED|nr:MLO-like protein 9 [Impatiens glandulifera]